jgi:hypothetical protein
MPKRISALTDDQIINAPLKDKNYKLSDGGGMHLLITTTGSKLWRFDYRFQGKCKTLALGRYPDRSIEDARDTLREARQLLTKGVDPSTTFRQQTAVERQSGQADQKPTVSVRIGMDGAVDLWKGRLALRLTTEEACFVKDQLCKLLSD